MSGQAGPAAAAPTKVTLQGKVREVGAGPAGRSRAMLVTEEGERELVGATRELRTELLRLSGATVRVMGWTGETRVAAPDGVLVEAYEILEVGRGVKPRIGTLAAIEMGGEERLLFVDRQGKAELLPKGWARKMKKHLGAKIWIVGGSKDGELRPERFAILRSRPRAGTE